MHRSTARRPSFRAVLWSGLLVLSASAARAEDPKPGDPPAPAPAPAADPPAPAPAPAPAGDPVKHSDAVAELERLKQFLKDRKADTEDLKGSLDAVAKAYQNLGPDDPAADAAAFEKVREKYQADAEDLFLDALMLVKVKPNTETNERDDVNVKAAQILGKTRPKVSGKIINILDTKILKAKGYTPPTALYDELMKSLASLNDHKVGLTYVQENWIKYSNTPPEPDVIKAAFDGLVLFKEVPGARRYEIVKEIVKIFPGVEQAAERNKDAKDRAQKLVWDKIKTSVVKALQDHSLQPKDPQGQLLSTVRQFQEWFREHENPKKAPWVDPKPASEPPAK